MRLPILAAAALLAAVQGCRMDQACTDELGMVLIPRDTVLSVGGSFTPRIALSSCGGRKQWQDRVTVVISQNTAVATVANTTVTGVAPGATQIVVEGDLAGAAGAVNLVVR